jgi:SAM-dependent methyltransferase
MTAGNASDSGWTDYYEAAGDDPRDTLLDALRRFEGEPPGDRSAVDLGCGTGRDTVELLRRGWAVLAIDGEAEALERLVARDLPPAWNDRLTIVRAAFQEATWPETDLVNSSFALPFCPPVAFPGLWQRIERSLRPGGRFCGQLFGDRDGWSDEDDLTFQTRAEMEALLASLEIERLDEIEEDGSTATGRDKHWHLFHVVARKPGASAP